MATRTVKAGSRLVLHTHGGTFVLRAVEDVALTNGWSVPVIADSTAVEAGPGEIDIPTEHGAVRVPGVVRARDGRLTMHPLGAAEEVAAQRRRDVRGRLELSVRAQLPFAQDEDAPPAARQLSPTGLKVAYLRGHTVDISAGGFMAYLTSPAVRLRRGSGLYLELDLPNGVLAPSVVAVVEHYGRALRAQFVDIAPGTREALARLVFAQQRAELAERRVRREGARS